MPFDDEQHNYFSREINRILPVRNTADNDTISNALRTSDPFEPGINTPNVGAIMAKFDNSQVNTRDAACRALLNPSVGMHGADDRTGCGWWYTPDSTKISVGSYGTRRGPMNPRLDESAGSGRWIWDTNEAVRLEGAKQGSRLKNCTDIQ